MPFNQYSIFILVSQLLTASLYKTLKHTEQFHLFLLGVGYCRTAMKITGWDNSPKLARNTYQMLLNTVTLKAFHTAVQELQSYKLVMLLNRFRCTKSVQLHCLQLPLNSWLSTHIQYSHVTLFGTQNPLQLGTFQYLSEQASKRYEVLTLARSLIDTCD